MNCTSFEELIDELRGAYNHHVWKVEGTFQDGEVIEVTGVDDDDCMERLIRLEEKHGKLVWWTSENYPLVHHN